MARIFLSYRRDDSRADAGRLFDRLGQYFGRDNLFMDVDTIALGVDFVQAIQDAVGSCDVLLAVIGRQWLTSTDPQGQRRLDNPEDFVRLEITTALERRIRVIPVLVGGAAMPRSAELPDVLQPLARRQTLVVGDHFHPDVDLLITVLETVLKTAHPPPGQGPPTVSPPEKPPGPAPKSPWVSVVTVVSLVIAAVSVLAAVIVIPEVRQWLGLDTPPAQRKTSAPVSPPQEITTSLGMTLVRIPAGEFQMGSNEGEGFEREGFERPAHRVRISAPFYLGKYEVTQAQWKAVMGTNPSYFTGNPNRPVENVSWEDVQEFIKRLNQQEGWEVCRLPTEAQWEYAARAGTTTARYADVGAIAWYAENSGNETHAVGQKRPNAWGLYDMLGNMWEWCHDGKRTYTADTVVDPIGPTGAGALRVIRGGSWDFPARFVRAAARVWLDPSFRFGHLGFRCASSGRWK
jgi:formylglycine-generating enzyme required for sulfatase activity